MLRQNILPREILEERQRISAYCKKCRETYLITQKELMEQSKLDTQQISRLEIGRHPWLIDTQIRYLHGVIALAKLKKYYDLHAKKTPECSIESIRKFLNQHSK